jgi:hypothetical protein
MNLTAILGLTNPQPNDTGQTSGGGMTLFEGRPADTASFKQGQQIAGEVISYKGNEIILKLEDGSLIAARLSKDNIPITVGQQMTFEVKSNGERLSLAPLYENMGHDPNALKALTAAGLPDTNRNLAMVSLLMREGLPVDKNFLLGFGRDMAANQTVNPQTLAQMARLEIPITPENIRQFEAYRNYEHQISDAVRGITDGLINDVARMAAGGEREAAVALFRQILTIFGGGGDNAGNANVAAPNVGGATEQLLNFNVNTPAANAGQNPVLTQAVNAPLGEAPTALTGNTPAPAGENSAATPNPPLPPTNAEEVLRLVGASETRQEPSSGPFVSLTELPPENREQLAALLRDAGFSATLTNTVNTGNLNQATFVQLLLGELWPQSPSYNAAVDLGKLAGLFSNRDFQALVKNDINNQWLMKPEELAQEKQVSEHFKQVMAQANRLLNALGAAGRGDAPVAQATNNLSNNVNFLNQLNQAFTYIQLPLKMNGENTHGELFVYTNKKHLARNDGNVSALLHLDMENLGPLDVYVAMQNKKVSTKFYLANEQVIGLVSQHIHVLSDRLTKRGYAVNYEFAERETSRRPVDEILEANRNVSIIGSYSFDARA